MTLFVVKAVGGVAPQAVALPVCVRCKGTGVYETLAGMGGLIKMEALCPTCPQSGSVLVVVDTCPKCLPDAPGYELTGGAEWKLPDGRWVRSCLGCCGPDQSASPGSGLVVSGCVTAELRPAVEDATSIPGVHCVEQRSDGQWTPCVAPVAVGDPGGANPPIAIPGVSVGGSVLVLTPTPIIDEHEERPDIRTCRAYVRRMDNGNHWLHCDDGSGWLSRRILAPGSSVSVRWVTDQLGVQT